MSASRVSRSLHSIFVSLFCICFNHHKWIMHECLFYSSTVSFFNLVYHFLGSYICLKYILQEEIKCFPVKSICACVCLPFPLWFWGFYTLQYHIYTVYLWASAVMILYFSLCTFELHRMHFYLQSFYIVYFFLWWIFVFVVKF